MMGRALADMNADGQMDLNEFSIACKLITMKLQGYEIPAALPPSMLALSGAGAGAPAAAMPPNPYGGMSHGMMPAYSMATSMPMGMPMSSGASMGMPMSSGAPMGSVPYSTTMGGIPGHMPGLIFGTCIRLRCSTMYEIIHGFRNEYGLRLSGDVPYRDPGLVECAGAGSSTHVFNRFKRCKFQWTSHVISWGSYESSLLDHPSLHPRRSLAVEYSRRDSEQV